MKTYNSQVVTIVNSILNDKFELEMSKLVPTARLNEDLNLDSLDFVDMFVILEQKLGQTPQEIDFLKIQTLGDIYQMVSDLQSKDAGQIN